MSDIPKKSVETFGFRIASQASTVLASILLARMLGPYGKGIFTYVGSVMSVLGTLSAGQSVAISWQYGRLKRPSGVVLNAMLRIIAFAVVPIALLIAVFALTLPGQIPLIAVAVALPFASFNQLALGFFLADGNVRVSNVQALITSVGFVLSLIPALFIFHGGLNAVLLSWVALFVIAATFSALRLQPYARGFKGEASPILKEQAIFGIRVSANSLVALLNFRVDVFIILFVLGAKALGVYSIAIGFGELMWQLSRPLAISAYGRITSGSKAEAAALTAKCVRHALALVSAGCVAIFFLGPPLIKLVYGGAFAGAGPALRFLLPGIIAYSVTPFLSGFFTQQLGKPTLPLMVSSLSTLICAIATLIMVRPFGIVGGAIATSLSYVVAFIVSASIFSRETGTSAKAIFLFRPDDIRPYRTLATSVWNRATGLAHGRRS